jgi:hypothetical protein
VFKREDAIDDYVKTELHATVKAYLDVYGKAQARPQKRWNTLFAIILVLMFGLFLFEGYVVYQGYSVVLQMQEAYKKSLKDWYAIPDYKSDKKDEQRKEK